MTPPSPIPRSTRPMAGSGWPAPDGEVRGARARRGDRPRRRHSAGHAQRAAGRPAARLSRPVGARPARAVRLRPSRPASPCRRPRASPQALGLEPPATTPRPRPSCSRAAAALLATLRGRLARARGRLGVGAVARPAALAVGAGRRAAAEAAGAGRALAVLEAARMGGERRRGRQPRDGARRRRTRRSSGWPGWSAAAPRCARASATMPPPPPACSIRRAGEGQPNMLLAEAGTGIGKTLGYLAPASLWAEKRRRRGLGLDLHQGAAAPARPRGRCGCSPMRTSRRRKVVVRKGRENYLCLLNLEDALQGGFAGRAAILAQLVARWAAYIEGRRHGRRRPARLARHPVPPRRRDRADRPARRMRLCRLPALPQMLHRALRAGQRRTPTSSSPTTRW